MTPPRQTVNVQQAMDLTGVCRRTIYAWVKAGKVQVAYTVTGRIRIYRDSLWMAERTHSEPPASETV